MSYLLTEIALEMLGYKFYDIDGNLGPTSFQQISKGQLSQLSDSYGESLQKILDFDTESLIESNDGTEHNSSGSKISKNNSVRPRTFSTGLKKLLDLEYGRLRSQVEQTVHRDVDCFIDENEDKSKDESYIAQDSLKAFIRREKEKLENEARTLQYFRKLVEKSTFKMNQDVFNQYKKVFVGSNKSKTN